MKRASRLFETILERDNLRLAFHKALHGKRGRHEVRQFAAHLDKRLDEMARRLRAGTFRFGRQHQFVIHDPKERIITAPCLAERVVHHAVMNVCEPFFDAWLIDDTYACRRGRGRVAALQRAQQFARQFPFFLKLDVRRYFDSIPHALLLDRLARRFKDRRLLELFGRIVGAYRSGLGRGIPIGSLTSQHFANFYLGWLDRLVKERWRLRGYVRYMDDMALWGDSRETLKEALAECEGFLHQDLGLELNPPYLNRTAHGMGFLGCRLYRRHTVLSRRSQLRYRRKLVALEREFAAGRITETTLQARATALTAFTRTAGLSSWRFRQRVLQQTLGSGHRAPTA